MRTEIFVHFNGIKINIITSKLDHNKLHSKIEIVSLKTEMVFGITFNLSSATICTTHIDKITQSLTKFIPISKLLNILLFKIQIMGQAKTNHKMFYIIEQDVTEQINMIRHIPKKNSSQIQPNNALTYQVFRTGCNTLLKHNKSDLFQSTESLAHCVSADVAMRKGIAAERISHFCEIPLCNFLFNLEQFLPIGMKNLSALITIW